MAFRRLASSVHSAIFSVLLAFAVFAVAGGLGAAPAPVVAPSPSAPAPSARVAPVASGGRTLAAPAASAAFPSTSAASPASRVVYLGVYLHDITKVSLQDGTVDVDAEVWVKWRGDFDPERVVLANGGRVNRTKVREEADGDWHAVTWRIRGPLRGEFPLGEFPFDRQKIALEFSLPTGDGILEPDFAASTVEEHFSITGWVYDARFVPRVETRQFASDLGRVREEGRATDVRLVASMCRSPARRHRRRPGFSGPSCCSCCSCLVASGSGKSTSRRAFYFLDLRRFCRLVTPAKRHHPSRRSMKSPSLIGSLGSPTRS